MKPGEGLYTDMHAVRKDYFLDYDHSTYGEVSVTVWPKILKDICRKKNIHVLE